MPDESEIDEWFSMRKEELSERMQDELEKGAPFEQSQARFDKEFHALLSEYDKRFRAADAAQARHERLAKPLRSVAAWWHGREVAFELWWKLSAEERKRRKFERKYKRLFKQR